MPTNNHLDKAVAKVRAALVALEHVQHEHDALHEQAPDLVGLSEAAELLETSPQLLSRARKNGRVPAPIAELACGPVWLRAQFTFPNTLKEGSG